MGRERSIAAKRLRRERRGYPDDCSTLCFPQKENISNMEAEQQQSQGPQRQTMEKINIPSERDNCSDCGKAIIFTVWCVSTFICK